jgi:hypothetical protein
MNKKGVSAIILTMIILVSVIFVIAGILVWNRQIFSSLSGEKTQEKICSELKFDADDFCYETLSIENIETGIMEQKTRLNFNVRGDSENQAIEEFLFVIEDASGNTQTTSTLLYSRLSGFDSKVLSTDFLTTENINEIKIIPKITFNQKIVLCEKEELTIKGGDISRC